ncbi:hypothetical protein LTR95_018003 [Oleoguttula sp. CCFEE 5521]
MRQSLAFLLVTIASFFHNNLAAAVTIVQPDELAARPNASLSTSANRVGPSILAASNGLGNQHLRLEIVNHYPGTVNTYVTGQDANTDVILLKYDGRSTSTFLSGLDLQLLVQGGTSQITVPDYLDSGCIYAAAGGLHFTNINGTM